MKNNLLLILEFWINMMFNWFYIDNYFFLLHLPNNYMLHSPLSVKKNVNPAFARLVYTDKGSMCNNFS